MHTSFFRQLFSKQDRRAEFEEQFRTGEWAFLEGVAELSRYSIITGYCQWLEVKSVLDVGCGQGVLAERLKPLDYAAYLGVDFSAEAVSAAQAAHGDRRTRFVTGDAAVFQPDGRFDAIVFNECLYYLDDPAQVLADYARALATPNGRFIVSIHRTPRNERVWPLIDKVAAVVDAVTVTNQAGTAWIVKLMAPRG